MRLCGYLNFLWDRYLIDLVLFKFHFPIWQIWLHPINKCVVGVKGPELCCEMVFSGHDREGSCTHEISTIWLPEKTCTMTTGWHAKEDGGSFTSPTSDRQPIGAEGGKTSFLQGCSLGRLSNAKRSALNICTHEWHWVDSIVYKQ